MSWIPLLLAAWVIVDVVVVAAIIAASRRKRERYDRLPATRPVGPAISARPTSRLVH